MPKRPIIISELKRLYPEAKFAYNAVIDKPNETWFNASERTQEWNEVLKKNVIDADAVVLHLYTDAASSPERLIENLFREIDDFNTFTAKVFPDQKVWVTEYNIKCDKTNDGYFRNAYAGQWIHGMHSLVMTLELMLLPQVDLLCFHDIAAEVPAATIYAKTTQIPLSQGSSEYVTASGTTLSASGHAFTLLGYAMKNASALSKLSSSSDEKVQGTINAIQGYLFHKGDQPSKALLVNFSDKARSIDTRIHQGKAAVSQRQYAASSLVSVINSEEALTRTETSLTEPETTLPPYSITVLTYQ